MYKELQINIRLKWIKDLLRKLKWRKSYSGFRSRRALAGL